MGLVALIALALVEFHAPNGHPVAVNAHEVSSLRPPATVRGHWAEGAECIIVMTNGRVHAVAEDCTTVLRMLQAADRR